MIIDEALLKNMLIEAWAGQSDPSHDFGHVERVVNMAKLIGGKEEGDLSVIVPAAWLHDCINLPKNHKDRKLASRKSADYATEKLSAHINDESKLQAIHHAIAAHSFSARITPDTLEARIVQDADRLDSLGAIGIARTFSVSGALGRPLFDYLDPLAEQRSADDGSFGLDHFFTKLFKLPGLMNTSTAKSIAENRVTFMRHFVEELEVEICPADR